MNTQLAGTFDTAVCSLVLETILKTVSSDNKKLEKSLQLKKLEIYRLEIDLLRVRKKSCHFTSCVPMRQKGQEEMQE